VQGEQRTATVSGNPDVRVRRTDGVDAPSLVANGGGRSVLTRDDFVCGQRAIGLFLDYCSIILSLQNNSNLCTLCTHLWSLLSGLRCIPVVDYDKYYRYELEPGDARVWNIL
jgi:hypothetical protein